jgi:hypothetical protein
MGAVVSDLPALFPSYSFYATKNRSTFGAAVRTGREDND